MFEQFITSIDYAKLIKMQAMQPAPFSGVVKFERMPKKQLSIQARAKVKTLGRKK